MTTITLPRAVVEQALEALEDAKALLNNKDRTTTMWFADEITALRAALAQQAEPVRFRIEVNEFLSPPPAPYSTWGDALDSMIGARAIQGLRISALAQKPQPVQEICPGCEATLGAACGRESCPKGWEAAPPQRKPLSEEEIIDAVRDADLDWAKGWTLDEMQGNRFATLARAVERAHGIGEGA